MMYQLDIQEDEMTEALYAGLLVDCSFGPSGVWVDFDGDEPLSPFVEFVLLKRGILNENLHGAGI